MSGLYATLHIPEYYILDESVFAFILAGNLVNFKVFKDRQLHSSPGLVYRAFRTVSIRVWSIVYLNTAYQSLLQINELLHTFFYLKAAGSRGHIDGMLTTYKVLENPMQVEDNCWDVSLTDLNSNGVFKIKVRLKYVHDNVVSGIVTEGPETYLDKILTVEILAGYSLIDKGKVVVDASGQKGYRFKKLSELAKEDRLEDITEPAHG